MQPGVAELILFRQLDSYEKMPVVNYCVGRIHQNIVFENTLDYIVIFYITMNVHANFVAHKRSNSLLINLHYTLLALIFKSYAHLIP